MRWRMRKRGMTSDKGGNILGMCHTTEVWLGISGLHMSILLFYALSMYRIGRLMNDDDDEHGDEEEGTVARERREQYQCQCQCQ